MDKEPSVIFFIHFHAMVFLLDGRLLQKANHTAAQLPAPLSGNDLYHLYFFLYGFIDYSAQLFGDGFSISEDIMKIEYQFGHGGILQQREKK